VRRAVVQDERAIGELVDWRVVMSLRPCAGIDAFVVQLCIDRVGARLSRVERLPGVDEPVVVRATAQCAGAVACREGCRLVEEEQLGELPRLQQFLPLPILEPELARDPAPAVVASPDPARAVVQAPTIPVDEPTLRCGDQLAERGDAILPHVIQG
jgi:hypothetical protein